MPVKLEFDYVIVVGAVFALVALVKGVVATWNYLQHGVDGRKTILSLIGWCALFALSVPLIIS